MLQEAAAVLRVCLEGFALAEQKQTTVIGNILLIIQFKLYVYWTVV